MAEFTKSQPKSKLKSTRPLRGIHQYDWLKKTRENDMDPNSLEWLRTWNEAHESIKFEKCFKSTTNYLRKLGSDQRPKIREVKTVVEGWSFRKRVISQEKKKFEQRHR